MNAVVNLQCSKMQGVSWLVEELLACQEVLCCVNLVSLLGRWLVGRLTLCDVLTVQSLQCTQAQ